MSTKVCRDCGYELTPKMRGCPRCALNLEAEAMIDRFVFTRLLPGLLIVSVTAIALLIYLLR